MVSTRGIKARFSENERVLCYEPDPTKAKVLYESKVLQIVYNKDGRGRKQLEYLIHFQGWNASWDRCVDEDLVLKDTQENRTLQKILMEDAQIKLKEKKKKRRLSDTIREIALEKEKLKRRDKCGSDAGSQEGNTDEDDSVSLSSENGSTSSSSLSRGGASVGGFWLPNSTADPVVSASSTSNVTPSSVATAMICLDTPPSLMIQQQQSSEAVYAREFPIEIPASLKSVLERDYYLIKENCKVLRLPSPLAALSVLESYVVFFAGRYLARTSERRRTETKLKDKAYLTLDLCKEVMDGIRVCFDFHCNSHLLYSEEQEQAATMATTSCLPHTLLQTTTSTHREANISEEEKDFGKSRTFDDKSIGGEESSSSSRRQTRSGVRANEACPTAHSNSGSGRSTPLSSVGSSKHQPHTSMSAVSTTLQQDQRSTHRDSGGVLEGGNSSGVSYLWPDLSHWTLLPVSHRTAGTPTLLYGPMHLLRLFVKLPEILYRMNLPPEKRKIIMKHVQLFLEYLDVHNQDLFSESHYMHVEY